MRRLGYLAPKASPCRRGGLALLCALMVPSVARAAEYTYLRAGEPARTACGSAPANWSALELDDRAWPNTITVPVPVDGGVSGCNGTLYARWKFDVGPELPRLATVQIRLRYEHGFAAYLNGVEVARRRLDPGADAAALATEFHNPEPERIFVPVRAGVLRPTGNLLAIEVHPKVVGKPPLLDVELSAADGPRIVRGPYLLNLTEREVTVVFDTDLPTLGEVRWGASEAYGQVVSDGLSQHHALRIRGLKPGTAYHYRALARTRGLEVASRDDEALPISPAISADAGDARFHTPPGAGKPLRFIVYGDVRSGHDVHAQLQRSIADEDPDFALVTGDLVDRGTDEGDWERFFEIAGSMLRQVTIFPAPGNHEFARTGRGMLSFLQHFKQQEAYYSFDLGGVHFVALDSNQYSSPQHLAWLEKDLADARKRGTRAIFAFAHEGPWSTGMHGDHEVAVRQWAPVLERHRVSMFFYGHDHHYERGRVGKLDYLVTGGGGAGLRPQKCGIPGKKACPPRVHALFNEHHYVVVELLPQFFRICPKRPDGMPLEACVQLPIRK